MTRKSTGGMPSVSSASISSPVFMLPICAAKAAPVRPATTTPVMTAPISRNVLKPTMSATQMSPPNCRKMIAPV